MPQAQINNDSANVASLTDRSIADLEEHIAEMRSTPYLRAMSDDKYYRRQASDAQVQADKAISPVDKAAWLWIGQSWLALISKPVKTALEKFKRRRERSRDGPRRFQGFELSQTGTAPLLVVNVKTDSLC